MRPRTQKIEPNRQFFYFEHLTLPQTCISVFCTSFLRLCAKDESQNPLNCTDEPKLCQRKNWVYHSKLASVFSNCHNQRDLYLWLIIHQDRQCNQVAPSSPRRYCMACATCGAVICFAPSKSATVRATRKTR